MNDNQSKLSKHKLSLTPSKNDYMDDLATPYFRKSVSYLSTPSEKVVEEKINDFLENLGIYFVEQGNESIYQSRKKCSIQSDNNSSTKFSSLSDATFNKTRLSSFDMNSNDLFQRRKLSSIKMGNDGQ